MIKSVKILKINRIKMSLFNTDKIRIEDLKMLFEKHTSVKIIDVRSKEKFDQWHIPGSEWVPVNEALKTSDDNVFMDIGFNSDKPVVVVCQEGFLSRKAMEFLRDLDLEAYSLEGGIKEWSRVWNLAKIKVGDTKIIQIRRAGKGCLSYLIINNGEAAVIDTAVDPGVFIDLAGQNQATIKYVLDTHIHADHFSRGRLLAGQTGASLLMPGQNLVQYDCMPVYDNDIIRIGQVTLKAIHTPGHTDESFSYLLDGRFLFTGDLLFLNGAGRPDLKSDEATTRRKTKKLYHSLKKILSLPGDTLILPGHYHKPVRFDGKPVAETLENLKKNLPLINLSEKDFILEILTDIPDTPPNYEQIVELNIAGHAGALDLAELEAGENRCNSQR